MSARKGYGYPISVNIKPLIEGVTPSKNTLDDVICIICGEKATMESYIDGDFYCFKHIPPEGEC